MAPLTLQSLRRSQDPIPSALSPTVPRPPSNGFMHWEPIPRPSFPRVLIRKRFRQSAWLEPMLSERIPIQIQATSTVTSTTGVTTRPSTARRAPMVAESSPLMPCPAAASPAPIPIPMVPLGLLSRQTVCALLRSRFLLDVIQTLESPRSMGSAARLLSGLTLILKEIFTASKVAPKSLVPAALWRVHPRC